MLSSRVENIIQRISDKSFSVFEESLAVEITALTDEIVRSLDSLDNERVQVSASTLVHALEPVVNGTTELSSAAKDYIKV